jgi:hypothetical protein
MSGSVDITTEFVFPGEGAVVFGELVTPDTPIQDASVLDEIAGWGKNRERPEW